MVFGKIKALLALDGAWNRVRKEIAMGHGKAAIFGLGAAIVTGVMAYATSKCPCLADIVQEWPTLLSAGFMAGVGVYLKSPSETKG